ncbi:serine/threonine protein kinase with WD40 repeats [Trichodesmium erythraeum IMS101]|uniref:Serine/threonine protein kinase with WD40 repeats n=1 Tax=Trichodesmium erythraeum (strain IMS101) TaxID=203124 RepID=Q10XF2_TRIEI|nr:serine/threonine protein kinase [Trichodesmium erythraeum GBRTRLIN201]
MVKNILDGRYKIIKIIESEGLAHTYLAQDIRRPGAAECFIKHLQPSISDQKFLEIIRRRFQQEAQILEKLSQNNQIPKLLAYFEENQEFYLVQSFIPGKSLDNEILPGRALSEIQIIRILIEVLEILVFVHRNNVIHRDIKPANLIRRKLDNKLVLIDFGAIKEINIAQPSRTARIGTMEYMPIEQFEYNPQLNSDIYALGMMGIQGITGLPSSELSKLKYQENGNKKEIFWRNRINCSTALADVLDKMVRYNYRERYQSATEVIEDLKEIRYNLNKTSKIKAYQEEVIRRASYRGDISPAGRGILEALRENLELSQEETEIIEDDILNPYRKYQEKGKKYEQRLRETIQQEYPFTNETLEELKYLQQVLGLTQEDVKLIEDRVVPKSLFLKLKKTFINNYQRASISWLLIVRFVTITISVIFVIYIYIKLQNDYKIQQEKILRKEQQEVAQLNLLRNLYRERNYEDCISKNTIITENSSVFSEAQDILQKCKQGKNWENYQVEDFSQYLAAVSSVVFSPDGKMLATGSRETTVKILEIPTGKVINTFPADDSIIWSVAFNSDATQLVAGTYYWRVMIWNVPTVAEEPFQIFEHRAPIWSVVMSPDDEIVASSSGDKRVKVWNLKTGSLIFSFPDHSDTIYSIDISSDGKKLVSGSADQTIKIEDLDTGDLINTLNGHTGAIRSVKITPDGKKIVSGSYDTTVKIWDLKTGKLIKTLSGHTAEVISVDISRDGRYIASGGKDNNIKVWDLEKGELLNTLTGHTDEVYTVAFSPDGNSIASGGKDRTIKLWQR